MMGPRRQGFLAVEPLPARAPAPSLRGQGAGADAARQGVPVGISGRSGVPR